MQYNTQTLLFNNPDSVVLSKRVADESVSYAKNGFVVIEGVENPDLARKKAEEVIASSSFGISQFHTKTVGQWKLAKADRIPVCKDSVETAFQGLHFDMGQPFADVGTPQLMIGAIGLYMPQDGQFSEAETRILPLQGLFADREKDAVSVALERYAQKYGDGWEKENTGRISCFARAVDAVSETSDLKSYYDKTMAEWFPGRELSERVSAEADFYKKRGVNLSIAEKRVRLKSGMLLVLDNTRVVHGRVGLRQAEEIYQFMFGLENIEGSAIEELRSLIANNLCSKESIA